MPHLFLTCFYSHTNHSMQSSLDQSSTIPITLNNNNNKNKKGKHEKHSLLTLNRNKVIWVFKMSTQKSNDTSEETMVSLDASSSSKQTHHLIRGETQSESSSWKNNECHIHENGGESSSPSSQQPNNEEGEGEGEEEEKKVPVEGKGGRRGEVSLVDQGLSRTLVDIIKGGDSSEASQEETNGRERLKRHRVEVEGRVWIPDIWGQEDFLKDWIDCSAFDSCLVSGKIMSAKEALVEEGRRANSGRVRIENRC